MYPLTSLHSSFHLPLLFLTLMPTLSFTFSPLPFIYPSPPPRDVALSSTPPSNSPSTPEPEPFAVPGKTSAIKDATDYAINAKITEAEYLHSGEGGRAGGQKGRRSEATTSHQQRQLKGNSSLCSSLRSSCLSRAFLLTRFARPITNNPSTRRFSPLSLHSVLDR